MMEAIRIIEMLTDYSQLQSTNTSLCKYSSIRYNLSTVGTYLLFLQPTVLQQPVVQPTAM